MLVSAAAPNHYWDCEVYAAAAADMAHVASLRPGAKPIVYVPHAAGDRPPVPRARTREEGRFRPGSSGPWLQRRERWMR